MTARAWLLTTWGRIRETLQPELFALRRELEQAQKMRSENGVRATLATHEAWLAKEQVKALSERLAQRTRELKAARAKVQKLDTDLRATRLNMQDAAAKK